MRVGSFIDQVCNELQIDDLDFKRRVKTEILPDVEKKILSISPDGNSYPSSILSRKTLDSRNIFLLPANYSTIISCYQGTTELLPSDEKPETGRYGILRGEHQMAYNYPMYASIVHTMNIKYPRTTGAQSVPYVVQALDMTAFLAARAINPLVAMNPYFYEVGRIWDNENVFYLQEQVREPTILRLVILPSAFNEKDDEINLVTEYGSFTISVSSSQPATLYLAEDGSTYQALSNTFVLSSLTWRSPYKKKTNMLSTLLSTKITLDYVGWSFPYYSDNDDDQFIDRYESYVRNMVLMAGAKIFKLLTLFAEYKNQYEEDMVALIRDSNIKRNRGMPRQFGQYRQLGRTPQR